MQSLTYGLKLVPFENIHAKESFNKHRVSGSPSASDVIAMPRWQMPSLGGYEFYETDFRFRASQPYVRHERPAQLSEQRWKSQREIL